MSKNNIKKLIISIILISFLTILFLFVNNLKNNNYSDRISIVKNIIKEKYDDIKYIDNYTYSKIEKENKIIYQIYDLNGNKLYSIKSDKELNIVSIKKRYYILFDEEYHLYNIDNEEITKAKKIEALNEYLVKVNNTIINLDNEVLFNDLHSLNSYDNDNHFNINNYYLVDKKGDIVYENVLVKEEIKTRNKTDYLIIEKEDKYYTFFVKIDKIIGDGFTSYKVKDNVEIENENDKYIIYKTGLRKKIENNIISNNVYNKYNIKSDLINNKYAFVTNKTNGVSGIIDINTNKFTKIKKGDISNIKQIDSSYCVFTINNKNYLYNIENKKIEYSSINDLSEIVVFKNNYKTVKNKDSYILLDNNDLEVIKLDKQIIIDNKIKIGKVNKEFYLYKNKKSYLSKKIIINKKIFYSYLNNEKIYITDDFKTKYKSKEYLSFYNDTIVKKEDNKICFYDLSSNKEYIYETIDNSKIINEEIFRDTLVIEENDNVLFVDLKGNVIKELKDTKIIDYYYNKNNGKIIIITVNDNMKGSYVAE